MSAAQRETYQRTGEIPAEIKPTFDGDSSPPKPAEQAVETATPVQTPPSEAAPKGKGAEARKIELEAEINDLLKKRAELRKETQPPPIQTPPAASSPAPVELGPKPDGTDYTKYPLGTSDPQFIEDLASHMAKSLLASERAASAKATADARSKSETDRIRTEWAQKVDAVKAQHPDVIEKFSQPIAIPAGSAADLWVLESEMGPATLYHLYDHPEEVTRITALSPLRQIEAMVLLGQSLKDAAPVPKTKTDAPPPVPALDTRPAAAANDADAALARGDFKAYTRIMNDQETAGLRSRK